MARKWADQKWALADFRIVAVWFLLLAMGLVYPPLIFVAFGLLVVAGVALLVRYRLRERRLEKQGPPPFWADEI